MKRIVLLCTALLLAPLFTKAQQKTDYPADVVSIDALIEALYATISGEQGEPRQWDRFRNLFIPEARLIPTGENDDGTNSYRVMSPEEFIENTNDYFVNNGFYEYEISREEHHYGRIVHLFSAYASKRSESDAEPFNRGINSIQLFNDGDRWWVVTIYWAHESEKNPIPDSFLN